MPVMKSTPATDSSTDLRNLVGDDATAEFEDDPKFAGNNPAASASSENLAVQRDIDDTEESDEEIEDEEEDEDEEDEEAGEDDEEDLEDEEDEDEDLDEEEDEEDLEDDEDEVGAAAA
ncbi:MAG TPA: hypothetical protein VIJ65_07945 [Acidobacteriaceae bacterium]